MLEEKAPKTIQSVNRALDILEFILESGNGYPLATISEKCGLNKTTAFHLLKTLENRGYIEQSFDTHFYKSGWKLYSIATSAFENQNIVKIGKPYMEKLFQEFNETVLLCYCGKVQDRHRGICFCQLESTNPLHTTLPVGSILPLHCTSVGKTYLMNLPKNFLDQALNRKLESYTNRTITDPDVLRTQLFQIKKQGYCIEMGEYQEHVCTLAVPVIKYTGRTIFSLVISMPEQRAQKERLDKMITAMLPMAKELSAMPF